MQAARVLATMTWVEKLWGAVQEADDAADTTAASILDSASVLPESLPAELIGPSPATPAG